MLNFLLWKRNWNKKIFFFCIVHWFHCSGSAWLTQMFFMPELYIYFYSNWPCIIYSLVTKTFLETSDDINVKDISIFLTPFFYIFNSILLLPKCFFLQKHLTIKYIIGVKLLVGKLFIPKIIVLAKITHTNIYTRKHRIYVAD